MGTNFENINSNDNSIESNHGNGYENNDNNNVESLKSANHSNGVANGVPQIEVVSPSESSDVVTTTSEVEVYDLDHVKRDFYDKAENAIIVLYLKNVISNSVKVNYDQQSLTVLFRTTDDAFLKNNHKTSDTVFRWNIPNLRGEIVPSLCSHVLSERKLEIRLRKVANVTWARVDNPNATSSPLPTAQRPSLTTSPPLNNSSSLNNTDSSVQNGGGGGNGNGNDSLNKSSSLPKVSLDDSALHQTPSSTTSSPKPTMTSSLSIDIAGLNEQQKQNNNSNAKSLYRSRLGMRGLINQSNNCYQNAVIQILANSPHLRHYCLEKFADSEINRSNPLGSKGKMVVEFTRLIRELWSSGERQPPVDTAQSVGSVAASRFRPFFQHDAQEFVTYLLDTIHEDLNRGYGRQVAANSDNPTAESAWSNFLLRNDSPLVEMFYGQICNRITCQHCFKESNAYDPFMMLPLPVARPSKSVDLMCLYVPTPLSPRDQPVRVQLSVPACVTMEEIKQKVRNQLNTSHVTCELKLYALQNSNLTHFWRASDVHALTRQRWAGPKGGLDVLIYETQQSGGGNQKKQQNVTVHVCQMLSCSQGTLLECAYCRKKAEKSDLPRCTRCQGVAYCNIECQKAHWKAHKANCIPFEQPIGLPLCFTVSQSVSYEKFFKMVETGVKRSVSWSCQDDSHPLQKHAAFELAPDDGQEQGEKAGKQKKQAAAEKVVVNASNFHSILSEVASNGHILKLRLFWLNGRAGQCRLQMATVPLSQYELLQIVVPVSQDRVSLNDCFRLYFEPELMHSANAWMCPQCKKNRTAIQRSLISRFPRYLIVYLKRFSQDGFVHKDREHVLYPSILDVSQFVADEALPAIEAETGGDDKTNQHRQRQTSCGGTRQISYHLYGVVNHYGTMQFGHYTSCARLPSLSDAASNEVAWRMFDDELVEEVSPHQVVDMLDAYILFYQLAEPQQEQQQEEVAVAATAEPVKQVIQTVAESSPVPTSPPQPTSLRTAIVDEIVEHINDSEDEDDEEIDDDEVLGVKASDLEDVAANNNNNNNSNKKLSVGINDLLLNDDTVD